MVRLRHRLLLGEQLLLSARRPRPAPGERERHEVRLRVRGPAQPEVRRGVRAQLLEDAKWDIPAAATSSPTRACPTTRISAATISRTPPTSGCRCSCRTRGRSNRKLTIKPGLRFDNYRGSLKNVRRHDATRRTAWGPRLGFACDMFGNGRTVVRGHYGRYFDGAKANYYNLVERRRIRCSAPTSIRSRWNRSHEPYLLNPGSVDRDRGRRPQAAAASIR